MDEDFNKWLRYEGGQLYWKYTRSNYVKVGQKAGTLSSRGYIHVRVNGNIYMAHRIIWEMHNGAVPEGLFLDHINGDSADNRLENLRLASHKQNAQNAKTNSRNQLGLKGVKKNYNKYLAYIYPEGETVYLGSFDTPEEASNAYLSAAKSYYGDFANGGCHRKT